MIQLSKNLKSSKFSSVRDEDKSKLDYLEGHSSKINVGIITADNEFILTASGSGTFGDADNKIRVWSVKSRNQQKILKRHSSKITALDTTLDYQFLFSGDNQGLLLVWKFETEEVVHQVNNGSMITFLKFDQRTSQLFGSIRNSTLKVWKFLTEDLSLVQVFKTDFDVNFFYLSKNSTFFMINNANLQSKCFFLYGLEDHQIFKSFQVDKPITCITIKNDQTTAIIGSQNHVIFFETSTSAKCKKYSHKFSVILAEVSNDDSKLMTCTLFSFIIWDLVLNSQLFNIDHVGKIIQVSSDFQNFLTSQGKTTGFYNLQEGKHRKLFNTHRGVITSAFTSPENYELVTLGVDSMLKVWDSHTLQIKNNVLVKEEFWQDLRLLKSEKFYLICSKATVLTMKLQVLLESSVESSDLIPKDDELSENFQPHDYDNFTWESIQRCRF
jgi:WD40 repeat protein